MFAGNPEAFDKDAPYVPVDQHAALVELQRIAHDKMKNLLRTRTLRGFPMNVPFTDVEELLTKVSIIYTSAQSCFCIAYAILLC